MFMTFNKTLEALKDSSRWRLLFAQKKQAAAKSLILAEQARPVGGEEAEATQGSGAAVCSLLTGRRTAKHGRLSSLFSETFNVLSGVALPLIPFNHSTTSPG